MDKATGQCPQTTTFLKRKESRSGIEPRSFHLPAKRHTTRPNRSHLPILVHQLYIPEGQRSVPATFSVSERRIFPCYNERPVRKTASLQANELDRVMTPIVVNRLTVDKTVQLRFKGIVLFSIT